MNHILLRVLKYPPRKNDLFWILIELILNRSSKEAIWTFLTYYLMTLQCYTNGIRYHTELFDSNTGTGDFQFQFTGDFKSWVLDYILVIFRFQLFLHHLNQVRPWIEPNVTCSGFKAEGYHLDWLKSKNKQKLQLFTKPIEQCLISDHLLEPDFLIIRSICPIKLAIYWAINHPYSISEVFFIDLSISDRMSRYLIIWRANMNGAKIPRHHYLNIIHVKR